MQTKKSKLSILTLNVDRRLDNIIKLNYIINKHDIDIVLLQDIGIANEQQNQEITNVAFNGYNTHKSKMRQSLWTMVKKDILLTQKDEISNNKNTNTIGSMINYGQHKIYIINTYIRPRTCHEELQQLLNKLEEKTKFKRVIIAGDFNATAPSWDTDNILKPQTGSTIYHNIKMNRGRTIDNWLNKKGLRCINNNSEYTFTSSMGGTSTIDLIIMSENLTNRIRNTETIPIQTWGHKALFTDLEWERNETVQKYTYRKELINESDFIEVNTIHRRLSNNWSRNGRQEVIDKLETMSHKLYKNIIAAQNKIRTQRRTTNHNIQFNSHTKRLITKLRKIGDKTERKQKVMNTERKKLKNKIINRLIQHSVANRELWDRYKRAQTIMNQGNYGDTNREETINEEACEQIAEEKFPQIKRDIGNVLQQEDNLLNIEITDGEIQDAIYQLRKKRYTGPEGIKFEVFLACIKHTKKVINTICKMSFRTGHIPQVCKMTTGCVIPKKQAGKYRIVHVGTPLSSLLEHIALARLQHALEEGRLINKRQFGFTASRGRHDLIARVIELTISHRVHQDRHDSTDIISLDIDGAFDNVDQTKLINKIHNDLGGKRNDLRHWLTDFILGREIRLKIKNKYSNTRKVCKGVPQGSPLGPILWNYTINDIDREILDIGRIEALFYADDIIIVCNGIKEKRIQTELDTLTRGLHKLNLGVNAQKCRAMKVHIGRRRRKVEQALDLNINGERIPSTDKLNILGITVNSNLKVDREADTTTRSLAENITSLNRIRQANIINSNTEWRCLIYSLIISVTADNNFPMLAIDKTTSNWMDHLITKSLKLIFGWSNKTSNKLTRLITDIPDIKIIVRRQITNRLATEHRDRYTGLMNALDNGQNWKNYYNQESDISEIYDSQMQRPFHMRYRDPSKGIESTMATGNWITAPTWIISEESNKQATANLMVDKTTSIRAIKIKHERIQLAYFNTYELIRCLIHLKHNRERNLAMNEKSSILMALRNSKNSDPRIVYLREAIHERGWRIIIAEYQDIKENLKKIQTTLETTANDPSNKRAGYMQTPFWDYEIKIRENKITERLHKEQRLSLHSNITNILDKEHKTWSRMNPSWIDTHKLLMLAGMVQDENGKLRLGRKTLEQQSPIGCHNMLCRPTNNIRSDIILTEIDTIINSKEAIIHRAFNCCLNGHKQKEILEVINKTNNKDKKNNHVTQKDLEKTLRHRRFSQTLLRILAETAFPKK